MSETPVSGRLAHRSSVSAPSDERDDGIGAIGSSVVPRSAGHGVAYSPDVTSRGAAFFDLDRTLLSGASGAVVAGAMRMAGLTGPNPLPGERLMFGLFNAVGETLPAMVLARQAVTLASGRSRAAVAAAAESVADDLCSMVQPFAQTAFATHREAGRPIVLATTTPYDLVKPFADRLGPTMSLRLATG